MKLKFPVLASFLVSSLVSFGADIYWDGGNASWNTASSWSTDPANNSPDPLAVPGASDSLFFNRSGNNAVAQTITLDANQAAAKLSFSNTGTNTLTGGGTNRTLTIGSGGLTVANATGLLTIGSTTAGQQVPVVLSASQTWTTNGGVLVAIANGITGSNTDLELVTGAAVTSFTFGATSGLSTSTTSLLNLGTGVLSISGPGNVEMGANSNTMGGAVIKSGNVFVRNGNNFGTTGTVTLGNTTGSSAVQFRLNGNFARPLSLQSGTTGNLRIDTLGASTATITGGVTGTNKLQVTSTNAGNMNVNTGAINNTGSVEFRNIGTAISTATSQINIGADIGSNVTGVTIAKDAAIAGTAYTRFNSSSNSYTGDTTIQATAQLRLGNNNVIPDGAGKGNVIVNGTLNLRGHATGNSSETINGLSGSGLVTRSQGSGTSTLTVGGNNATSSFSGSIENGSGTVALSKTGTGTLTLSGSNSYTGPTVVSAGSLLVNGSLGATAVDVSANGTIGGDGTIGGTITLAGTISPGNSPGTLGTVSQSWSNGGDYNWQILNATGAAGTGFDTTAITGTLDLTALTTGGFSINLWSLSSTGPDVNGNASNFDNSTAYSWTLASTTLGIIGFEATDFLINQSANNGTAGFSNALAAGGTFAVDQSGNNLVLTYSPVPEPAAAALGLLGFITLLRRRRS